MLMLKHLKHKENTNDEVRPWERSTSWIERLILQFVVLI